MSLGKNIKWVMCIKMMYSIMTLKMYSNFKWLSSVMQNHNHFCTYLIDLMARNDVE